MVKKGDKGKPEKEPEKKLVIVSRGELAEILGVSERRIDQLVTEGVIKRKSARRYVASECVQAYFSEIKSGSTARQRLYTMQAEKAETDVARMRGDLLLASDVHELLIDIFTVFSTTQDGNAGRLANELARSNEPAYIRKRLLEESRAIRRSAAAKIREHAKIAASVGIGADSTDTTTRKKRSAVGKNRKSVTKGKR